MMTRAESLAAARDWLKNFEEVVSREGKPIVLVRALFGAVAFLVDAIEAGPDFAKRMHEKSLATHISERSDEARLEGVMKGCAWAAEEVLNWWTSNPQGSLNALLGNIRRGPQPDAAPKDEPPLPWESCPVCNPDDDANRLDDDG